LHAELLHILSQELVYSLNFSVDVTLSVQNLGAEANDLDLTLHNQQPLVDHVSGFRCALIIMFAYPFEI
jgi:hypothetical protein